MSLTTNLGATSLAGTIYQVPASGIGAPTPVVNKPGFLPASSIAKAPVLGAGLTNAQQLTLRRQLETNYAALLKAAAGRGISVTNVQGLQTYYSPGQTFRDLLNVIGTLGVSRIPPHAIQGPIPIQHPVVSNSVAVAAKPFGRNPILA